MLLQACAAAEAAYVRAINAISKLRLVGECDGATLRPAMEELSSVPELLAMSHSTVGYHGAACPSRGFGAPHDKLTGCIKAHCIILSRCATAVAHHWPHLLCIQVTEKLQAIIKQLQTLVNELRAACDEVSLGSNRARRSVEASRGALKAALRNHQEACRVFDLLLAERQRGGRSKGGVESDPWLTEGRLVEAQAALLTAQQEQRQYLAGCFGRVGDLERRRVQVVRDVVSSFVASYAATLVSVQQEAGRLQELVDAVDGEADLLAFNQTAGSSVRDAEVLSQRQAEMLASMSSALLGSSEILR